MLAITDLKAGLVSEVNLGRLVVFERGSQRLFALRVNAGRDVTPESAALLVFGLQDDGVLRRSVGHAARGLASSFALLTPDNYDVSRGVPRI